MRISIETFSALTEPRDSFDDRHPRVAELVCDLLLVHSIDESHHGDLLVLVIERGEQLDGCSPHFGFGSWMAGELGFGLVERRIVSSALRPAKLVEARAIHDAIEPAQWLVGPANARSDAHEFQESVLKCVVRE